MPRCASRQLARRLEEGARRVTRGPVATPLSSSRARLLVAKGSPDGARGAAGAMASFVQAFVAENVAELRRMNARQVVQQIVALGAPSRAHMRSSASRYVHGALRRAARPRRTAQVARAARVAGRRSRHALRLPSRRALTRATRRADRHLRAGDLEVLDGRHRQRVAGARWRRAALARLRFVRSRALRRARLAARWLLCSAGPWSRRSTEVRPPAPPERARVRHCAHLHLPPSPCARCVRPRRRR